jgi:hypothetical protein
MSVKLSVTLLQVQNLCWGSRKFRTRNECHSAISSDLLSYSPPNHVPDHFYTTVCAFHTVILIFQQSRCRCGLARDESHDLWDTFLAKTSFLSKKRPRTPT